MTDQILPELFAEQERDDNVIGDVLLPDLVDQEVPPETDEYSRIKSRPGQGGLFSEDDHPRDESGRFTTTGGSKSAKPKPVKPFHPLKGKGGELHEKRDPSPSAREYHGDEKLNSLGYLPTVFLTGVSNKKTREAAKTRPGLGVLITPDTGQYVNHVNDYDAFAVDNGCFSGKFEPAKFRKLLKDLEPEADRAMFVVAPDVVGDWEATKKRSEPWLPEIRERGFPVAWVAQDGIERNQSQIPWDDIDVLFIGGSTEWKRGFDKGGGTNRQFIDMLKEAKKRQKPVHFGRINSWKSLDTVGYGLGASSADGTYLAFGPEKNLPKLLKWVDDETRTRY
ncbi:hypothetical protein K0U83_20880 [bacterium]|nr:hypothetical protein [bacterium]